MKLIFEIRRFPDTSLATEVIFTYIQPRLGSIDANDPNTSDGYQFKTYIKFITIVAQLKLPYLNRDMA